MIDPQTNNRYAARVGDLSSNCSVLTASILSDVNQVFCADNAVSSLSATNLSVRHVLAEEYYSLIAGELSDKFEPKTLYIVSSDEINAYGTQVKNVSDPEDDQDAANKWYVDYACESVLTIVGDALSADFVKIGLNALTAQKNSGINVRSIAIGKNADASNIAYNNAQSIAVGADCSAVGEASIAVGSQAEANGTSGSSPTGGLNMAIGYRSKADGKMAIAIGSAPGGASSVSADCYPYAGNTGSIAIGTNAKARAQYETIVGYGANGNPSSDGTAGTAFGASANASGAGAVAVGYGASASAQQSIAIGRNAKASAIRSIAIGAGQKASANPNDETTALSSYSIAIGFGAKAEGVQSIAIGGANTGSGTTICKVTANDAVQIGAGTNSTASSLQFKDYTIINAQGKIPAERISIDIISNDLSIVNGSLVMTSGDIIQKDGSFAGGKESVISGNNAFAFGYQTSALGKASHAAGVKANAEDDYSFVWSAISSTEKASNGPGTFSIYPVDGISGFYVGDVNMSSLIGDRATKDELDRMYLSAQNIYNGFILGCISALSSANAVSSYYDESTTHPGQQTLFIVPNEQFKNASLALAAQIPAASTFVAAVGAMVSAISLAGSQYYDGQLN